MNQEIEYFEKGVYKIHINDTRLKVKLAKWKDLRRLGIYYDKKGICGWDYLFPARLYNRVALLAGLPIKDKNRNRVLAGKQSKVADGVERHDLTKVKISQTLYNESKIDETSKDTTTI